MISWSLLQTKITVLDEDYQQTGKSVIKNLHQIQADPQVVNWTSGIAIGK